MFTDINRDILATSRDKKNTLNDCDWTKNILTKMTTLEKYL